MSERTLAVLTVTHRGVPIGTVPLVERDREHSVEPLLPPELRARLDREPEVHAGRFTPLEPGYAGVAAVVERAAQALANYGFLGPAADPASRRAGEEAEAALAALCDEIELRDRTTGTLLPAPVARLTPDHIWLDLDEAPAGVLARLRAWRAGGGESVPPVA